MSGLYNASAVINTRALVSDRTLSSVSFWSTELFVQIIKQENSLITAGMMAALPEQIKTLLAFISANTAESRIGSLMQ